MLPYHTACSFVGFIFFLSAQAQDGAPEIRPDTETIQPLKQAAVDLEVESTSFFIDMPIHAVVQFPELVAEPLELPGAESDFSLNSLDVSESYSSAEPRSFASLSLMARRTGPVTIPSFEFQSELTAYRTRPLQLLVSSPVESDAMSFEMRPDKTTLFEGQPLRLEVIWTADLITNQIRSLRCFPELFSRSDAEIVIPRNTSDEEWQMGMPFGGRRIIAERRPAPSDDADRSSNRFGTVSFPLFVRFNQAGTVSLPETRLEIAHLKGKGGAFSPYAAYFNNGLFEPLNSLGAYERLFTEAPAMDLEVLPLPEEGREEAFSGLFTPVSIEARLTDNTVKVGEIVEINLRVRSEAPHEMLELPPLSVQRSLRGRFRPSDEYGRSWHADGSEFLARARVLSTRVQAFPALEFEVFDPIKKEFTFIRTNPLPLTVEAADGKDYFDIRRLAPEPTLTIQPLGIWQNAQPGTMSDSANLIVGLLAEGMIWLILLAPVAYLLLLPQARERRLRAINSSYRAQAEAYDYFRKLPEQSEGKWQAFRHFLATGFSMPSDAWTPGDTNRLRETGINEEEIRHIIKMHQSVDAAEYSSQRPKNALPTLNPLGKRIFKHLRKRQALLVSALCGLVGFSSASSWDEAEALFSEALAATPGEVETDALFTRSALLFEAAAAKQVRPGSAWYNAGNAWFQAGEIGRAIAGYRQARIYQPFDESVASSLAAARALSVDVVEDKRGIELGTLPVRWLSAALVILVWILVAALLIHQRYRHRFSLAGVITLTLILFGLAVLTAFASSKSGSEGVVVTGSLYARKGPAYRYELAFNESLHDGLEFRVLEEREAWLKIQLADLRQCWIPADQVRRIWNERG
ncbi:MAG: hypothetical protein AAGA96_01105 [Verrucomicrobiota bacterium]